MTDVQATLLRVVSAALFDCEMPKLDIEQLDSLIKESKAQTVFPLFYSSLGDEIKAQLPEDKRSACEQMLLTYIVSGVRNFSEHGELHKAMTESDVPYVTIKGLASAMYYSQPSLRTMGDVDFFVAQNDVDKASKQLQSIGFEKKDCEQNSIHTIYSRPPLSIFEMHTSINGIPDTQVGVHISKALDSMIQSANLKEVDGTACMVPDKFHHGLVLLLHTASHLVGEGVGLRHLCDWVVFVSSMSDDEFTELFEDKLKQYGLWHFAQVLSRLGMCYLGAPKREWATNPVADDGFSQDDLTALMNDILNGGNFGRKDKNRYREIKFISNRGEHTVENGSIFSQVFRTLNTKVIDNYEFINKHRVFLPIGWVAEVFKYIGLLAQGKRKSTGTKAMLKEAAHRKNIYASLNIFKA